MKNFTAIPPQIIIRATMTIRGSQATSIGKPREAAFSNLIPCVSGRISAILCNAVGITSYGRVAPEKINMGKYKTLATILATFMFGPLSGIIMTIVVSLIQGLTVSAGSGAYGIIMHIIATSVYVLVAGLIYKKYHTLKGAVCSLAIGTAAMALVMIPANLFITPLFLGVAREQVVALLGWIIGFNVIKAGINGILCFVIYKPLRRILK